MRPGAMILAGIMAVLTAGSLWGGSRGMGLAAPTKETLSIREDSVRSGRSGRSVYFRSSRGIYGGGIHRGK